MVRRAQKGGARRIRRRLTRRAPKGTGNALLTEKQITSKNAQDERILRLYQESFPEEERIPFDDLIRLTDDIPLDFTAYSKGGDFIGFTIVCPRESFTWFWYFAVRADLRGRGIGQSILSSLLRRYRGRRCILDMESPRQACANREQRLRRHAFYLRNGFRDTHVYRSFAGVEYTIMLLGEGEFTMRDYDDLIAGLRRFWQPPQEG